LGHVGGPGARGPGVWGHVAVTGDRVTIVTGL
jgi:hypothetical protein